MAVRLCARFPAAHEGCCIVDTGAGVSCRGRGGRGVAGRVAGGWGGVEVVGLLPRERDIAEWEGSYRGGKSCNRSV